MANGQHDPKHPGTAGVTTKVTTDRGSLEQAKRASADAKQIDAEQTDAEQTELTESQKWIGKKVVEVIRDVPGNDEKKADAGAEAFDRARKVSRAEHT